MDNLKTDAKTIVRRSNAAWKIKDQWTTLHKEAWDLVMPGISPYAGDKNAPRPMGLQFDSTAPNSVMKLANRILMEHSPPHEAWIDLKTGSILDMKYKDQPQTLKDLNAQLAEVSAMMNVIVNQGDMVASRHAAYLDTIVTGTGMTLDLEDPHDDLNPIISQAVSSSEVALEKDARGRTVGVYRRRENVRIRDIQGLWPDAVLPKELSDRLKGKDDPTITLLECSYERDKSTAPRGRADEWHYEIFWSRDAADPERLVSRVYPESPWTIFEWMVPPGCVYSISPVLLALPDIRTANKIVEMILKNAALALAGMYLVRDDGVLNPDNVVIKSGGLVPVASTGGSVGASMVPLETGRNFDLAQLVLEKYQGAIKQWLFDNGLGPVTGKSFSATEIIQRVRDLTQDIGGGIGRLSASHVQYVRRKLGIAVRRGVIPFDIRLDQFTVKLQINSPLARAQGLKEVETYINWMQMVLSIGGPQLLMQVAKVEDIAARIGALMGVPPSLILSAEERAQVQDSMARVVAAGGGDALPQQA